MPTTSPSDHRADPGIAAFGDPARIARLREASAGPLQRAVDGRDRGPELPGDLGGTELQDLAEHQHGPLPRRQDLHRRHQREPYVHPHSRVEPRVGNGCSQGMSNTGVSGAPGSWLGAPSPDGNGRRARPSSADRHTLVAIRYNHIRTDACVPSYRSRAFHARSIVSCTRSSASWNEPSIR